MAGMERDEVIKLVRDHLSAELEVAPERIQPETRLVMVSIELVMSLGEFATLVSE